MTAAAIRSVHGPTDGVDLRSFGPDPRSSTADLLAGCGLRAVDPLREPADVGLLVGCGEPRRDLLDEWMAEGLPHLLVRLTAGAAVVGPFVVPGATPCLRCVDQHHIDADPRWLRVLAEPASPETEVANGTPLAPLVSLASAWAVAEIATWLVGERPATWSATLWLPAALAGVELVTWRRHPRCGCAWNGSAAGHAHG